MNQESVVHLHLGEGEENQEAENLLREAGIPYENLGQNFEEGASLLHIFWNGQEYYGLEGIKSFIQAVSSS